MWQYATYSSTMAQSIRVSDELYSLAQSTGQALGRPIAQQMEHWARLGAALEAAGISAASAMHLLGAKGSADELVSVALGKLQMSESERIRMLHMSDADQVANGKRTAKSLFVVRKEALEGFTFKRQIDPEPTEGEGW
ncbi:hypothetical protein EJP69_19740 [Variovorax gossypii]|uniref:ParD-like family protein n=2 Tax=Variovorax gossypii TaxID=1679495 RepID=A0A3S0J6Y9_9BURK|nr:hypothetical protein EJP69_19740 [Variovorax gossypii]